jgi:hypothetical protein
MSTQIKSSFSVIKMKFSSQVQLVEHHLTHREENNVVKVKFFQKDILRLNHFQLPTLKYPNLVYK